MATVPALLEPWPWRHRLRDHPAGMAWRPDGGALAVGSLGGEVVVLRADTGVLDGDVVEHAGGASAVAWQGGRLVTGGADGAVTVAGRRHDVGGWVGGIAVTATHDAIAVAHGRMVTVLDGFRSEPLPSTVSAVAWDPDRGRVAAGGFGYARWIGGDGAFDGDVGLLWGGAVGRLVAAPRTGWMAAGTRGPITYLWDRRDPSGLVHPLSFTASSGTMLGFSPAGDVLAVAAGVDLGVFPLDRIDPHAGPEGGALELLLRATALAWHPHEPFVALGLAQDPSGRGPGGVLVVHCADTVGPVAVLDLGGAVADLAWSPNGSRLATARWDGEVAVSAWYPGDVGHSSV